MSRASSRRLSAAFLAGSTVCLSVVAACGSSAPVGSADAGACAASDALWVASDYSSSAIGAFAFSGALWSTVGRVDLGADPALAFSRGSAFYVARDQDAVFALDPACGTPTTRFSVHQASHGGTSNPQDVGLAADGSLWVPLYGVPLVVILSPGGGTTGSVNLSPYDADGNPNASAIAIVDTPAGEKAFVALQRLDDTNGFASTQSSLMLRIDVPTATVEASVPLAGRNPFAMENDDGILWLAEPGNFDDAGELDAGVERFDTSTSTTALVVTEAELGASVAQVSVNAGCGAAIVADAAINVNATSLVTFDPSTGAGIATGSSAPLSTAGFDLEGLAWIDGAVVVGDRRRVAEGYPVHVLDGTAACALTQRQDAVFLPLPAVGIHATR